MTKNFERDFEQLQNRILDELEKIAFSQTEKVTVSQKLTALRLLARYIGMDKGIKPAEENLNFPVIFDNISDPRLDILFPDGELNREQRRALAKARRKE